MQVSIPCSTFKVDVDEMTDGSVLAVLLQFIIDSTLSTSKVFVLAIIKGFFPNKPFLCNFVYNLFYFNGFCGCPDVGYGSLETRYFSPGISVAIIGQNGLYLFSFEIQ